MTAIPLIGLGSDTDKAPTLNYSVALPTSYEGDRPVRLDIPLSAFKPELRVAQQTVVQKLTTFAEQHGDDDTILELVSGQNRELSFHHSGIRLPSGPDDCETNPYAREIFAAELSRDALRATPAESLVLNAARTSADRLRLRRALDMEHSIVGRRMLERLSGTPTRTAQPIGGIETTFPEGELGDDPMLVNLLPVQDEECPIVNAITLLGGAKRGYIPIETRKPSGETGSQFVPVPEAPQPTLGVIETHALSSFLGDYGAGKTLYTASLYPGEKTRLSVKTWRTDEQTRTKADSIFDAVETTTLDEFADQVKRETTNTAKDEEADSWSVRASAGASWGWGSAKVKAGKKGSTNASRERFASDVTDATQKHATEASSMRKFEVSTTDTTSTTTGVEETVEREIKNINLSRVLTFTVRELNQEYVTKVHLKDVRVFFYDPHRPEVAPRIVAMHELDELLGDVLDPAAVIDGQPAIDAVREFILGEYQTIVDWNGDVQSLIGQRRFDGGRLSAAGIPLDDEDDPLAGDQPIPDRYWFVKRGALGQAAAKHPVKGVLLSRSSVTLRTDAVIVDGLLGGGECLDAYSTALQTHEVGRRAVEVDKERAATRRAELENVIIEEADLDRALIVQLLSNADGESAEVDSDDTDLSKSAAHAEVSEHLRRSRGMTPLVAPVVAITVAVLWFVHLRISGDTNTSSILAALGLGFATFVVFVALTYWISHTSPWRDEASH